MTTPTLAARIEALDRRGDHAVHRLDAAFPIAGRVAVLPSAFNPPTLAHLQLLRQAVASAGYGTPAALLTTRNVDKGLYGADLHHRAGMLLALREEQADLAVLVSNAARIADQAKALRDAAPGVELAVIVGFDTLVRLFDDRYYEDMPAELTAFFSHCQVLASNRGEAGPEALEAFLARPLVREFASRVQLLTLEAEAAALSSTAAREAIAAGIQPPCLPASVVAYIRSHRLYQD